MFSIKQFLINASSEVRQEIRKLIEEIEASISAEAPVVKEAPASTKTKAIETKAKAIETEATTEG